ncbi:MAG: hypothetical protein K1X82_13795 [Bacteroidia bacterium]|nr:hypothetical protein [Bacteroidia bacterium]
MDAIRKIENAHVFLWLIKDLCWCMLSRTLGMLMVLPTVFLAIYITYRYWNNPSERYHNLAVVCWISANSTWMAGEFYFDDGLRNYALVFFLIGIALVSYYYLSLLFKKKEI